MERQERELRFTLRSASYLESALKIETVADAISRMQKGSVTCIMEFFVSCLIFPKDKTQTIDSDSLKEMVDDYIWRVRGDSNPCLLLRCGFSVNGLFRFQGF